VLNGLPGEVPTEVVDLQALGLGEISIGGSHLELGAMARLQDLVDSEVVPWMLRDLARREEPNTIRNAATVGGLVATANPESELLAGLLVFAATVTIARSEGSEQKRLGGVLADRASLAGGIITAVSIERTGTAAAERTARTPADRPIVAVVGRRTEVGTQLAMTGVADTPVLVDPDEVGSLEPPSDFRGSAEYRQTLAAVLAARVVARLEDGGSS